MSQKKWQVDLKEFEALLNSNYDTAASLAKGGNPQAACQSLVTNGIAVGLLAVAERLEAIAAVYLPLDEPEVDTTRKCLCELDFREGKAPGPDHETTCPRYKEVKVGPPGPD